MIEEAPEPKETSNYHFSQLRTVKIVKDNEQPAKESLNVVAAASKYGLLFVGIANGFKILKLENILTLDEDKENKSFIDNYYSNLVATETPILISLSADQKTLAVCVWRNSSVTADMYDIAAFADPENIPVPFQIVQLSGNGCKLKDFAWNPVADGMYSYCLSDGSLYVHELSGLKLTVVATLPSAAATAVCWSPKGKQLVVGKLNGSFSQYKPSLQEVKTIPAPNINEPIMVSNICWLSTTQFGVLYVPDGSNVSPYFFIVTTAKGVPVVYTNFYDVCVGNASSDDQRYFLHHESAWGVLTCASVDAIDVAVLGDPPSWVPWELREDGRVLLPIKNKAKCWVGMDVIYSAQRRIVKSETESYPPMPIIFFMTDNGLLVPYHMINSSPGCASLVNPPTALGREDCKRADGNGNNSGSLFAPKPVQNLPSVPINTVSSPQSVFQPPAPVSFSSPSFGSGTPTTLKFGQNNAQQGPHRPSSPTYPPPPQQSSFSAVARPEERFHKPSKGTPIVTSTPTMRDSGSARHMAVAQRSGSKGDSDKEAQIASSLPPSVPPQIPFGGAGDSPTIMKENITNQNTTYLAAIVEEIQAFDKEIQDLKNSSQHLTSIGSKEEMTKLHTFTLNFQEFQKDMTETMVSLNNDIHSLKNVLLESFVMAEEAGSRERRKNDHSYISMLKDRALDPMTAKRMQTIEQHYLYLSTQLQEVRNKLDQDWYERTEKKIQRQKSVRHVSSTEAIYKTIVNNQKIIHNLRKNVDSMLTAAYRKKLDNISNRRNRSQFNKKQGPEELSKLADAFLQAKISSSEEEKPQPSKKMSPEAQKALKNYLSLSNITTVRPTVIYSPSQSRLLSQTLLYSDKNVEKKSSTPLSESVQPITNETTLEKGLTILRPNTIVKPINAASPPVRITPVEASEKKIIPINKPQVNPGLVFEKLRLSDIGLSEANKPKVAEQSKPSLMGFSQTFTAPAAIAEPEETEEPDLSPGSSIASPSYEDITPPDSPTMRNRPISSLEGTKVLEVSLSRGIPEVQTTDAISGVKKNLMTSYFGKPQVAPEGKQMFGIPQTRSDPFSIENITSAFGVPSSSSSFDVAAPSTVLSDVTVKPKANMPSLFKPAATSFSFLPPLSTASSFSFSSKNDENKPTSSTLQKPLQDSFSFNIPARLESGTSTTSTLLGSENKIGLSASNSASISQPRTALSSLLNPVATTKPATTVQQPVATSASSFLTFGALNQPSKTLSFFPPALGSKSQSTASETKASPLVITSVQSMAPQEPKTSDAASIKLTDVSKGEATVPSSTPNLAFSSVQSAFNQSPVNLTQTKPSASAADAPLNLADTVSQSSGLKTFTLESIISSALDKKTSLSESEQANQQTFKSLFSAVTSSTESTAVATTTVATSSIFDNAAKTTASTSIFGTASNTTASSSIFGGTPTTTTSPLVFGGGAVTTSASIFGGSTPTTTASVFGSTPTTTASVFGSTPTTTASVFGSTPATTASVFGSTPTTTASVFGSTPATTASVFGSTPTTTASIFGGTLTTNASATNLTTTTTTSVFGQPTTVSSATPSTQASVFGQASGTTSSFFGQAASTQPAVFGQASVTTQSSSIFGQPATITTQSSQAAGSFFTQPLGGGQTTSVFGGNASNAGGTGFGEQTTASSFSFGKSSFGQPTQGSSFGLAKSVFGQNTQAPAFGQPASPSSGFGQAAGNGVFGQGSFFSGLGGKPSAENANKNVFGGGTLGASSSEPTSIFGGSGTSSFGAKPAGGSSFGSGSFSTGGGSVAQSGFGAFQQQTTPQKTGGFGTAPAFGGAPAFGSSPAFGSPPSFGSGGALGSVFGSSQAPAQTANFSNFASANAPTFGSLASQSPGGGFGSPQPPQQQPAFGQQPASPFGSAPVFGNAPAFGGTSGFGAASSPPGNTSAFTQWRN